jgi:hypothetical protein
MKTKSDGGWTELEFRMRLAFIVLAETSATLPRRNPPQFCRVTPSRGDQNAGSCADGG